jgi:hypothetical protein
MQDMRRITLVHRSAAIASRDWDGTSHAPTRIIFVRAVSMLEYALRHALSELERDVERVVIDRGATAAESIDLLARLPQQFHGDVLIIRQDGSGYLSATARGDGRVLYPLSADDIEFYLITHGLVTEEQHRMTA